MSENNNIPSGVLISGICMGHLHEEDNGYKNDYVVIKVGERQNEIGEKQSILERVSLFGDNLAEFISKANAAKGKHVMIAVNRAPARRDLRDAFMRNSLNRSSQIQVVS